MDADTLTVGVENLRMCDRCHEEHADITAALDRVTRDLEVHLAESHADYRQVHRNAERLDRVVDSLLGPEIIGGLHAGDRVKAEGIEGQVHQLTSELERINQTLSNGGIRAKLRPQDRAAVVVAALAGMASVVAALVG